MRSEPDELAHVARDARTGDVGSGEIATRIPQVSGIGGSQVDQHIRFIASLEERPDAVRLAERRRKASQLHRADSSAAAGE